MFRLKIRSLLAQFLYKYSLIIQKTINCKKNIFRLCFFPVHQMFNRCLFPVQCLQDETGERRQPPSCRCLNLFFVSSKTQEQGAGSGADAIAPAAPAADEGAPAAPAAPATGAGGRGHRSRSKTPKSCSEPDHFRPPPLEKKVVSGPGRQAQNRYITPTLRVSDFYLYLHHVQRFNS